MKYVMKMRWEVYTRRK